MPFNLGFTIPTNAATGLQAGQTVHLWSTSLFADPVNPPAINTAEPAGSPAVADVSFDDGFVNVTVAAFDSYFVAYYDPADTSNAGSYNIYWF